MSKYKHIGVILSIAIFIIAGVVNGLQKYFDVFIIDLIFNGLPYYVNIVLVLLMVVLFISFQLYRRRPILFIISAFVLQNLLYSTIVDYLRRTEDYDIFNDFSGLFAIPISFVGVVVWGILFDYLNNKKKKNE